MLKIFIILALATMANCGSSPDRRDDIDHLATKGILQSIYTNPYFDSVDVRVISSTQLDERFKASRSFTDSTTIYISDDVDFCKALGAEMHRIDLQLKNESTDVDLYREPNFWCDYYGL